MKSLTVKEFMNMLSTKEPDSQVLMINKNEPGYYPVRSIDDNFNVISELEDGSIEYSLLKDYDSQNQMSHHYNNPLDFFSIVLVQ